MKIQPQLNESIKTTPSRLKILKQIQKYFEYTIQWAKSHHYDHSAKYQSQAEGLIELLEVNDCGSIGGFDNEVKRKIGIGHSHNLFDRFIMLIFKHDQYEFFDKEEIQELNELLGSQIESIKNVLK